MAYYSPTTPIAAHSRSCAPNSTQACPRKNGCGKPLSNRKSATNPLCWRGISMPTATAGPCWRWPTTSVRAAIARSLVAYGFLPAFGIHHRSEQNAFNLADDLIEPYRPLVDTYVLKSWPLEPQRELSPKDKQQLVALLHRDITTTVTKQTLLAAVEASVVSLSQWLEYDRPAVFVMPVLTNQPTYPEDADG